MRQITKIIIHCTATREGQEFSVASIRKWHLKRGFRDIGYHYVIHLDGSIEAGRPVEQIGAHCARHNVDSIGVVYVGGIDKKGRAKDTRTEAQKAAMRRLVEELLKEYPGATVHGHNEYSFKRCPCFEVHEWWKEVGYGNI